MNLANLSNRLEITFWNVVIGFMNDRRVYQKTLVSFAAVVLTVAASLFSLAMSSIDVGPAESPEIVVTANPEDQAPNGAANGQHNTLVFMVDYLGDGDRSMTPQLEGVWLAAYLPTMPHLTFLPLYPASLHGGAQLDAQIKDAFYIQPDGVPGQEVFDLLRAKNVRWNNFIILDRHAIAGLMAISGVQQSSGGSSFGAFADGTQAAVLAQADVASRVCSQAEYLLQAVEPAELAEQLSYHLYSDFGWPKLMAGWYQLKQGKIYFSCEFPTLLSQNPPQNANQ